MKTSPLYNNTRNYVVRRKIKTILYCKSIIVFLMKLFKHLELSQTASRGSHQESTSFMFGETIKFFNCKK